jgi:hypothetical protein
MKTQPKTHLGKQLWRLLPEVYQERDNGDFSEYIDSFGHILDGFYGTLEQRLDDTFPDTCQAWLLPYIAKLLDVRLVSPTSAGKRQEVANAILWRKQKGTVANIEEIAKGVGRLQDEKALETAEEMEFEIQEAWKRLACTARINIPILPASALGVKDEIDTSNPLVAARYTGLPKVTLDFRHPARAEQSRAAHSRTRYTRFNDDYIQWQVRYPDGAPCFPGSYEDPSLRTPDLRRPDWQLGHFHPKQVLLFTPPPTGFFDPNAPKMRWDERTEPENVDKWEYIEEEAMEGGLPLIIRTYRALTFGETLKVIGEVEIDEASPSGTKLLVRFEGFYFRHTLTIKHGRVETNKCAFFTLHVFDSSKDVPALNARNSLIRKLKVPRGLAQLEYCTVKKAVVEIVHTSDSVFTCIFKKDYDSPEPPDGFVRYSSIPSQDLCTLGTYRINHETPVFFSDEFGKPGYGVLHPTNHDDLRFGAEEGGEMGAYHHRYYCLRRKAVYDKLKDFLPAGMQPVIVPDNRLLQKPPK